MTTYTKTELKRKRGFELINILKSLNQNGSYRNDEMIKKILELQINKN